MKKLISILLCTLLLVGILGSFAMAENAYCSNCGEEYPTGEGYAFCPNCGEPLSGDNEYDFMIPMVTKATDEEKYDELPEDGSFDLTDYVLNQLGNSLYRETYEALAGGETVSMGGWGTAAKGLQQTLIDLGQKLSADGQAGGKTFEALHIVQDSFGMDRTDKVDSEAYSHLLLRLLVLKEMDEDEYGVTDKLCDLPGEPIDYDECSYMMACADYLKGNYYKAKERFESCYWGDAEERAEKCAQPWPSNGQIWKDSNLGAGTQLTITVNGEPDVGMHVKIYTESGKLAAMLFVGGSGSASTWLPGGTYTIKDGTGRDWYGQEDSFGYYGNYEVMTFDDYGTTEVELKAGYSYTITINVQNASPDASNVGSMYDSYDDF